MRKAHFTKHQFITMIEKEQVEAGRVVKDVSR